MNLPKMNGPITYSALFVLSLFYLPALANAPGAPLSHFTSGIRISFVEEVEAQVRKKPKRVPVSERRCKRNPKACEDQCKKRENYCDEMAARRAACVAVGKCRKVWRPPSGCRAYFKNRLGGLPAPDSPPQCPNRSCKRDFGIPSPGDNGECGPPNNPNPPLPPIPPQPPVEPPPPDACGVPGGDGESCKGCDGVPNSGKEPDSCGVCGGDGTSCLPHGGCELGFGTLALDLCAICKMNPLDPRCDGL